MSSRDRVPELPKSALADFATDERVERVWKRLEGDLGSAEVPGLVRARARRTPDWVLWAAAALIVFAGGIFVGRAFPPAVGPEVVKISEVPVPPEPAANAEPAPAVEPETRDRAERTTERRPRRRPQRRVIGEHPPSIEPELVVEEPAEPAPPDGPPEWYRLWSEGELKKALEAIKLQGGFEAALEQASADEAMAMVDLARFSREKALAIAALRRVVDRYPADPNAPIAALTLGNMLEHAGDTKGAAEAFQAYRALSPEGDFAEDALARQIEAALEQRDPVRARELLTQYEQEFENGSRAEELRAELREVEAKVQSDPASAIGAAKADDADAAEASGESEAP